jgi:hypothetical protein
MTSGPDGVWPPRTEEQLAQAAQNGVLIESGRLDLKRELPPPSASVNRNFAKDVAAFSLEGGIIIIGVDEDTTPPSLHPVDLSGLAERVEQIAATAVDEGVVVTTIQINAAARPGHGYLIVQVPQSPQAPHMVDGKYYARGDKTNRVLSHAEVFRIHERNVAVQRSILSEAREALENARTQYPDASSALVFVLAKPLGAREDLLSRLTTAHGWQSDVLSLIRAAAQGHQNQFAPNLLNPGSFGPRLDGVAAATGMRDGRLFSGTDRSAEVVFCENGAVALTSERALIPDRSDNLCVFEQLILCQTDLVVRLATLVSQYGFAGTWRFALIVTGIKDAASYALNDPWPDDRTHIFPRETYERSTTASLEQLGNSPQSTVHELVTPLLRSINSPTDRWPWLFA